MLDVDYFSAHHALIEDQKSSPFEIDLGWTVSATKGPFNGRRALARTKRARRGVELRRARGRLGVARAAATHERGLPPQLPTIAWRASVPVYRRRQQVGYATSGMLVAAAQEVPRARAPRAPHFARRAREVEMEITVEHRRKRRTRTVRKLPFFDPERKRA